MRPTEIFVLEKYQVIELQNIDDGKQTPYFSSNANKKKNTNKNNPKSNSGDTHNINKPQEYPSYPDINTNKTPMTKG